MKRKLILFSALLTACFGLSYGQVTIGSGIEPVGGALLDLKEQQKDDGTQNSAKGLNLPRVNLINLKPTTAAGANSLPASIGAAAAESWDLNAHIGLTVYNVNQCPAGRTIYNEMGPQVWDGSQWQSLLPRPAIVEATPDETSASANSWGTGVVHHAAKAGVYAEFYSADFGAAGRWMTTNLAATAYDGIRHSTDPSGTATSGSGTSRTLTGPLIANGMHNAAYWCYPGTAGTNGTSDIAYTNNPHLGFLYTWDAATAGKGGENGYGSIYNTDGNNPKNLTDERNMSEGDGLNEQKRIQGVCPAGWHLPSDREWTDLENEIIRSTTKYANVQSNISPDGSSNLLSGNEAISSTNNKHNLPMLDICGINSPTLGQSLSIANNGFNVLAAGACNYSSDQHIDREAVIWSSSQYITATETHRAYWRIFVNKQINVYVGAGNRMTHVSVRCKKD